jgi:hypothetical protein
LAVNAGPGVRLFTPAVAVRTREGNDEAEATPPEVVLGENPPNGAPIDYALPDGAAGPVHLTILDGTGAAIRTWSSDAPPPPVKPETVDFPAYWLVPPAVPQTGAGMHRFVWDFHVSSPEGALAAPGRYTVLLETGGAVLRRPLVLRRDPRITATDAALIAQASLATAVDALHARAVAAGKKSLAADLRELFGSIESADAAPTPAERQTWAALQAQARHEL